MYNDNGQFATKERYMRCRGNLIAFLCLLAVLAWPSGTLLAQGRGAVSIGDPGSNMRTPGSRGGSNVFRSNSYGLGSLGRSSGGYTGPGGYALRSNMSDGYSARGSAAAGSAGGLSNMMTPLAGYKSKGNTAVIYADSGEQISSLANRPPVSVSRSYLAAISTISDENLTERTTPITSLVPNEPSSYRTIMERGETLFRSGSFLLALDEFKTASDIGDGDWPSMLSLMQTHFALSGNSFSAASYYLRRVLEVYPELPLLPLQPRGFYGNTNKYADSIVRLESFATTTPRASSEAFFLLAYFRWFDQDYAAASQALAKAYGAAMESNDEKLKDSIETFWRGMAGSGKVSGELVPVFAPKASASPASQPTS
jgi:hypothetical protein